LFALEIYTITPAQLLEQTRTEVRLVGIKIWPSHPLDLAELDRISPEVLVGDLAKGQIVAVANHPPAMASRSYALIVQCLPTLTVEGELPWEHGIGAAFCVGAI